MADAGGDEFDEGLAGAGFGNRVVPDDEVLAETLDYCCFHCGHHSLLCDDGSRSDAGFEFEVEELPDGGPATWREVAAPPSGSNWGQKKPCAFSE
ncbi:hypothetical protein GCM10009690_09190 [Brevibacterium permense]|uniref:Uncharacterized protein n=1 Tax=Brevibacterium permense TaxID=234834 RepID=A0ABN2A0E5_9MICO